MRKGAKQRRLTLLLLSVGLMTPAGAWAVAIVDTLGVATPATHFSVFGEFGLALSPSQWIGPRFTLTHATILTEIGGFLNNCFDFKGGVPQCPADLPLSVQIRPAKNGVPDAATVLASFILSNDQNLLITSYEFVTLHFRLGAGTYFALFAPQAGGDVGLLVMTASEPFSYQAGSTVWGVLDPSSGVATLFQGSGAARILGLAAVPEPGTGLLVGSGLASLLWFRRRTR